MGVTVDIEVIVFIKRYSTEGRRTAGSQVHFDFTIDY